MGCSSIEANQFLGGYSGKRVYIKQGLFGCVVIGCSIGHLHTVKGEFDKAIQYLERQLAYCRELNYKKGIAKAVNTLGEYSISKLYNASKYFSMFH